MKRMETFESGRELEVVTVSELIAGVDSQETAILTPRIEFSELRPGDEMIWRGNKLSYYVKINDISDSGKPRIEARSFKTRTNMNAVRAVIEDDQYALLGSCSGLDDYGSATDPELDVLLRGRCAWMLDDTSDEVAEKNSMVLEHIAILRSN